ncbi:hypothetical protein GCM10027299_02920 [Larkinella ripae]
MEKKSIRPIEEWTDQPESLWAKVGVSLNHPVLRDVIAFSDLNDRVQYCRNFY